MTQEIGEPVRTKYTSCPTCGVFKVKDGWNYGEQICVCGFGKRPTEDEIENEQYLTAQVHNMLIDLIRLEQENARLREALQRMLDDDFDGGAEASHMKCKHGRYGYEGCTLCYDEAIEAALLECK